MISYEMFRSGKTIKRYRCHSRRPGSNNESHLFKAYKEGKPIQWGIFFTDEEETAVLQAREQVEEPRLKPLKEALSDDYDYTKITAVLVKNGLM